VYVCKHAHFVGQTGKMIFFVFNFFILYFKVIKKEIVVLTFGQLSIYSFVFYFFTFVFSDRAYSAHFFLIKFVCSSLALNIILANANQNFLSIVSQLKRHTASSQKLSERIIIIPNKTYRIKIIFLTKTLKPTNQLTN
jgi:hypothetical protein